MEMRSASNADMIGAKTHLNNLTVYVNIKYEYIILT